MKRLILVAVLLGVPSIASADDYGAMADRFFGFLEQGKTDEALDFLVGTNRWLTRNADDMVQLRDKLSRTDALFGKFVFHELVSESRVGGRYVHQIHIVGFERQPVRCKLTFYKPADAWRIQNVAFDANLIDDVQKQADARIVK
jgi:hypothetical protein